MHPSAGHRHGFPGGQLRRKRSGVVDYDGGLYDQDEVAAIIDSPSNLTGEP